MNKVNILQAIAGIILSHCFLCAIGCSDENGQKRIENNKAIGFTIDTSAIQWDKRTLVKVAAPPKDKPYAGYARLIELSSSKLLCVYESDGNIWQVSSTDYGKSWKNAKIIAKREQGINMAVPDILRLKNGNLLLMYNPRPYDINPSRHFAICIKMSSDNGKSWGRMKEIYRAGYQFENGCWEPAAIQLPNGTIQVYFANEGVFTSSNEQNISMLSSVDNGESWSLDPKIISFRAGKRDGMPVPMLLKGNERIAVAIEDNGFGNFKPYIITNTVKEGWSTMIDAESPNRIYAMLNPVDTNIYAGAPYLKQLSTGETILSYQGTENRVNNSLNNAIMKVMVGDSLARNFSKQTEPFSIPEGKAGLWNSITILSDDTIIALTSTNGFSKGVMEVWMIKGRMKYNK